MGMRSNIKDIIKGIEKHKSDMHKATAIAQSEMIQVMFREMEEKYVVPGNNENGRAYLSTSEADIPRLNRINTKQGIIKRLTKTLYFSSKQVISRTGELLQSIKILSAQVWPTDGIKTVVTDDYKVEYKQNSVTITTQSDKARMMEIKRAAAGTKAARKILTKTFRSGIKAYNTQLKKLWKRLGKL